MEQENLVSDLFWFAFQERALNMGKHSARRGFGVPLLPNKFLGLKTGGYAAMGGNLPKGQGWQILPKKLADRNRLRALGIFEKAGLTGVREAEKTAAFRFGTKTASSVGKRFLIGRAAGIGLAAFNLSWQIPLIVGGVALAYGGLKNVSEKNTYADMGGYFPETQGSYTARQRTINAITSSRLQARSAVGNEAMLMHR